MDTEHPTDPATGGDEKNQSIANTTSVDPPALKRQRTVASTNDDEEDAPRALTTTNTASVGVVECGSITTNDVITLNAEWQTD